MNMFYNYVIFKYAYDYFYSAYIFTMLNHIDIIISVLIQFIINFSFKHTLYSDDDDDDEAHWFW